MSLNVSLINRTVNRKREKDDINTVTDDFTDNNFNNKKQSQTV